MPDPLLRRTILIGLGGAGKLILTHVKRLMIDTYGIVPPCVRLLALDTDGKVEELRSTLSDEQIQLSTDEFLYMKVDHPRSFIEADKNVGDWFVKPLPAGAIHNGAGAIRQVGRVAFFHHGNEFLRRVDRIASDLYHQGLKNLMQNARSEIKGAKTDFDLSDAMEIYVCGSLAGGTGSGTFIDVGIILRNKMPRALISGFFLLDWVYRDKAFAYRVAGNTYAALTELDSLQNVAFGEDRFHPYRKEELAFSVRYADREIAVADPPYSLVHLVDGRNERQENIGGVSNLCDAVAHAMFLSIGSMGPAIASVVDNLLPHIHVSRPQIWNGRSARYSSFGVSSLYYPAREMWRLLSLLRAQELCGLAFDEARSPDLQDAAAPGRSADIQRDVDRFFPIELGIKRPNVGNRVCLFPSDQEFTVQDYEVADPEFPSMLKYKLENMEAEVLSTAEELWRIHGQPFTEEMQAGVERKMRAFQENPTLDDAWLNSWIGAASDYISSLRDETSREYNDAVEDLEQKRSNCENLLDMAKRSRHRRFIGGGRKRACRDYAQEVSQYLQLKRKEAELQREKKFYETLLESLESGKKSLKEKPHDVVNALDAAKAVLRSWVREKETNLSLLKSKPNQVLLGNGNSVIVPERQELVSLDETFKVSYEDFKREKNIHKPADYLEAHRRGGKALAELFLGYCSDKFREICSYGAWEALEAIDRRRHQDKGTTRGSYITEQFDHLFRLAAPLWSFNKSALSGEQSREYDHIINIGLNDQTEGERNCAEYVSAVKAKHNLACEPAYSSTGDPQRIWLINYAAALPIFLLTDHEEKRKKYYDEMTPTYHIDPRFAMDAPDLFPVDDLENRVLRVLGMAIVSGIDVIRDEKLTRGHKFWCREEEVLTENFGEPVAWTLFREMFTEVLGGYHVNRQDNLLDIIEKGLKAKVRKILAEDGAEKLKSLIENHVKKNRDKLGKQDFTRLISARLTYREMKELDRFLDRNWYGLDIDCYIKGEAKRKSQ